MRSPKVMRPGTGNKNSFIWPYTEMINPQVSQISKVFICRIKILLSDVMLLNNNTLEILISDLPEGSRFKKFPGKTLLLIPNIRLSSGFFYTTVMYIENSIKKVIDW